MSDAGVATSGALPGAALSERKTAATAFLDSHARVDLDGMRAVLAPDARFHTLQTAQELAGMPKVILGADKIARMLGARHGANGEPALWKAGFTTWEHLFVVEEGDYVVIHTIRRSVTMHDVNYENPYVCMFQFEGSKITDIWEYLDTAYAFRTAPIPEETTSVWRGE
jgi:ketosteroid isomerase-like protein